MKKITFKATFLLLLACGLVFGQATGPSTTTENLPTGIQDNHQPDNPEGAELFTVLIAASPGNPTWIDDVEEKLENEGFLDVDTFLTNTGTPTLADLQDYQAVFVFTDAGVSDPVGFGNILADYIEAGGAVVDATFTANVQITGDYTSYQLYSNSGQTTAANLGFGTINEPNDPILTDVTDFDGGTSSFHNVSGTIANGTTVVAEYTDGSPLIITQENVGPENARRVFLNFYPPSEDARDDFWVTGSDGGLIMSNALRWVVAGDALSTEENIIATNSIFPNPAANQITITNTKNELINTINVIDITGRIVISENVNETSRIIDISALPSGVYFAQITQGDATGSLKFIKQ